MTREGIEFHLDQKVERVERGTNQIWILARDKNGGETWVGASHLLAATGRAANVEELDLKFGKKGEHGREAMFLQPLSLDT